MDKWIAIALLCLAGTACHSLRGPHAQYILPGVDGRVVDAQSGQPLADSRVQRLSGRPRKEDPLSKRGATRLMDPTPIATDSDGRFHFPSTKGGYLFLEHAPVYEFTLVVSCPTYQTLSTNVDLLKVKPQKTNDDLRVDVRELPLQRARDKKD